MSCLPLAIRILTRLAIDQVFRRIDREVWVVTAAADSRHGGLVATWAMQASIDVGDPLVMIGLAPNHFTAELVRASGVFGLHLLRPNQLDLAWRFALSSGRTTDKFAGIESRVQATGASHPGRLPGVAGLPGPGLSRRGRPTLFFGGSASRQFAR